MSLETSCRVPLVGLCLALWACGAPLEPERPDGQGQALQCVTSYRDQYHNTGTSCGTTSHSSICGPTSAAMLRQTMTCGQCAPSPGDVRGYYNAVAGLASGSCAVSASDSSVGAMPSTLASAMLQVGTGKRFDDGCAPGTVIDHCKHASVYTIADMENDLTPENGFSAVMSGDMSKVANRCCSCRGGAFYHTIFVRQYDPATDTFEVFDPDADCNHNPQPHPSSWSSAEMNAFSNGTEVPGLCALVGKGSQAAADCSTLAKPATPVAATPDTGLDFACGNSMRDTGADWSYGFYKADCSASQAATGLSMSTTSPGYAHDLLCRLDDATAYPHATCRSVVFDAVDDRPDAGDWDPGYLKGQCAPDEYVAAISQSVNLTLHAIECCKGQVTQEQCAANVFEGHDALEDPANDWDPGFWKGECGAGRYLAGVSQLGGAPHAILCCGAPLVNDAGMPGDSSAGDAGSTDLAGMHAVGSEPGAPDGGPGTTGARTGVPKTVSGGCGTAGSGFASGIAVACLAALRLRRRGRR